MLLVVAALSAIGAWGVLQLSQDEIYEKGFRDGSRYSFHWVDIPFDELRDFVSNLEYRYWYITEITPAVVIHLNEEEELILYNDDVNTFDFVIETLVDVCEHDTMQAEQCALVAHYRGKCSVKAGIYNDLKPMYDEIIRRGINVEIK